MELQSLSSQVWNMTKICILEISVVQNELIIEGYVWYGMVQIYKSTSAGEGNRVCVLRALMKFNNSVDAWVSTINSGCINTPLSYVS